MITALYICSISGSTWVGGQKYPTHPDPDWDAARKKHPGKQKWWSRHPKGRSWEHQPCLKNHAMKTKEFQFAFGDHSETNAKRNGSSETNAKRYGSSYMSDFTWFRFWMFLIFGSVNFGYLYKRNIYKWESVGRVLICCLDTDIISRLPCSPLYLGL